MARKSSTSAKLSCSTVITRCAISGPRRPRCKDSRGPRFKDVLAVLRATVFAREQSQSHAPNPRFRQPGPASTIRGLRSAIGMRSGQGAVTAFFLPRQRSEKSARHGTAAARDRQGENAPCEMSEGRHRDRRWMSGGHHRPKNAPLCARKQTKERWAVGGQCRAENKSG
eukprot:gene16276-biopygen730